jgi:hypothetical protein
MGTLVIYSYLDNSAQLPAGTPVAELELVAPNGSISTWSLRVGVETGEWAARRPDVAALPGFRAPPTRLAWLASDGRLFAQRYRALWSLETPIEARHLRILRSRDLPPESSLAVFHLELRP